MRVSRHRLAIVFRDDDGGAPSSSPSHDGTRLGEIVRVLARVPVNLNDDDDNNDGSEPPRSQWTVDALHVPQRRIGQFGLHRLPVRRRRGQRGRAAGGIIGQSTTATATPLCIGD